MRSATRNISVACRRVGAAIDSWTFVEGCRVISGSAGMAMLGGWGLDLPGAIVGSVVGAGFGVWCGIADRRERRARSGAAEESSKAIA